MIKLLLRQVTIWMRYCALLCIFANSPAWGNNSVFSSYQQVPVKPLVTQDSLRKDSLRKDAIRSLKPTDTLKVRSFRDRVENVVQGIAHSDHVQAGQLAQTPFTTIQQMLKGESAGLYVQEKSGEPGTLQAMTIRGLTSPLITNKDRYGNQPAVYLNGIPLIGDHPFVYNIQGYDFNPIGPATNLLSQFSVNNIKSIDVVKDPAQLARLGPEAANGAIWIVTKNAKSGEKQIEVNSYYGQATKPTNISTTNAAYENDFRRMFYDKYATAGQKATYPAFLYDQTNARYYGASQWSDLYYQNNPLLNVDLSITGGNDRANFRFFGSHTSDRGAADQSSLDRSSASFFINMVPFSWLTVSSMVNATRLNRKPNKNLRDRFAEMEYIPDINIPIAPSGDTYQSLLSIYDNAIDENINSAIQGYVALNFLLKKIRYTTRISFDYNEGLRNTFYPSTLMNGINYASGYFGYNQRAILNNTADYNLELNSDNSFLFSAGTMIQSDIHRYNYSQAYHGANDFIKVPSTGAGFIIHGYTDKETMTLMSSFASVKYDFKDFLSVNGTFRVDGSSNVQPDHRWLPTGALCINWDLKKFLLKDNKKINNLAINLSAARIGKLITYDKFSEGPQYTVDLGYNNSPDIFSYNASAVLSRPYSTGWVGYQLGWPYSDQIDLNVKGTILNRVDFSVGIYHKQDKNQIIAVPVPEELGYTQTWKDGLSVTNRGIEAAIGVAVIKGSKKLNWYSSINAAVNQNRLSALPDGQQTLVLGNRKLQVGKSIDQFWLLENNGIYTSAGEMQVNPANNKPLSYYGLSFSAGDPKWKDQNGDYVIDDNDKVLKGHSMPALTGGWNNRFSYKKLELNVNVVFALGQDALNSRASNKFNFANLTATSDIRGVQEIFFWQKDVNIEKYPVYNPWSAVIPYQLNQDLFLENASYLKLRAVTLSYDFTDMLFKKGSSKLRNAALYVTGANLATITGFKGTDPELIDFNGLYSGYGLPIPRSFIVGFKLNL